MIARNAHGRPTLQHKLSDGKASITDCGTDISMWSRAYQLNAINEVLCRKNACRE